MVGDGSEIEADSKRWRHGDGGCGAGVEDDVVVGVVSGELEGGEKSDAAEHAARVLVPGECSRGITMSVAACKEKRGRWGA